MVRSLVYDSLGYLVGEPEVPNSPLPPIVVWGDATYVAGDPDDEGRPQYYWRNHFVIPETREQPKL